MVDAAFPFAKAEVFTDRAKYLGGEIHIIPAQAASANLQVPHTLRRLPRAFLILDIGTNPPIATPLPRGATAWSFATFSLNLPTLTAPLIGLLL